MPCSVAARQSAAFCDVLHDCKGKATVRVRSLGLAVSSFCILLPLHADEQTESQLLTPNYVAILSLAATGTLLRPLMAWKERKAGRRTHEKTNPRARKKK